ncbi:hypothetical protein HPB47_011535 [Ixodes persulcatus]|uniref:Uncharacterized protein n=1 Tax=Ixodes persulcatus TaxID=34615 RepID=A0AC60NW32_IXOPE|nr:hypothetical protein HPB47_011535 [Ixodes persulcatus]
MSVDEPAVRVRQRRDDDLRSPSPDAASSASSTASSASATATSSTATSSTEDDDEPGLPYPGFVPVALYYFVQDKPPRSWCLRMLTNPYPFGTALYGMWIVFPENWLFDALWYQIIAPQICNRTLHGSVVELPGFVGIEEAMA